MDTATPPENAYELNPHHSTNSVIKNTRHVALKESCAVSFAFEFSMTLRSAKIARFVFN